MNVYLYNNEKRLNSTKAAPSVLDTLTCTLKDNCSFIQPVLRISASTLPTFNYFKFENRYYWLTNLISLANNLWEIHGTVDVLTTFSGHILNTQAFVLYDSTPNTQIPDDRLAIETDCTAYTATAAMPWNFDSGAGTYIIATTGNTDEIDLISLTDVPDNRVGTGVYTIPQNQLKKLGFDMSDWVTAFTSIYNVYNIQKSIINSTYFTPGPDIVENISNYLAGFAKSVGNGFDYVTKFFRLFAGNILGSSSALSNIKASYWLPFELPSGAIDDPAANDKTHLALGNYTDIILGLKEVVKPVITSVTQSVSIPWQFTDWRNVSCTEVMLYIPLIGCINIPSEVVKGNNTIEIKIALNIYSGAMAVEVMCGGATIGTYGTNTSMPILIGDSNANIAGVVNTIGSAVTKNYMGAAVNGLQSFNEMVSSVGGIGGGAGTGLSDSIICICRVHDTSQSPSALLPVIGTPTRELKALTTSLGYCQCLNAQVNNTAISGEPYPTQTEIEMINNYLNSGVYLE